MRVVVFAADFLALCLLAYSSGYWSHEVNACNQVEHKPARLSNRQPITLSEKSHGLMHDVRPSASPSPRANPPRPGNNKREKENIES